MSGPGLEFPCQFPIKVLGHDNEAFHAAAMRIVAQHAGDRAAMDARTRSSSGGRYIALSFVVQAQSREQLDALYQDLSDDEHIMVVL